MPPPPPPAAAQLESAFVPEAEFAARYPHPITIRIQVPNDPSASEWNLQGQVVDLSVNVTATIKEVKEMLSAHIGGMPANRQQLKHAAGFLKDASTLAAYNIGDHAFVEMLGRSRGGRR
jgi:splicing factor 3A subunit 1